MKWNFWKKLKKSKKNERQPQIVETNLSSQALDTFLVSRADNRQEYSNFDAKSFRKHENFRILENSMTLKMEKMKNYIVKHAI